MGVSTSWESNSPCELGVQTKHYNFRSIPAARTDCSRHTWLYGSAKVFSNGTLVQPLKCVYEPAWLTSNISDVSHQFRLLKTQVQMIECTETREPKNAGNVWTRCGDDFTAWIEMNVPRPKTCDIPGEVPCNLTGESITKAQRLINESLLKTTENQNRRESHI